MQSLEQSNSLRIRKEKCRIYSTKKIKLPTVTISSRAKNLAHLVENLSRHRGVCPTTLSELYPRGALPPDLVLHLGAPDPFAVVGIQHSARRTSIDGRIRLATLAVTEELATMGQCPPHNEQNVQGLKVDQSSGCTQAGGQTICNIFF